MRVRFFNGGYCLQLQAMVDRSTWRIVPFQAVFIAVEHPSRGWLLIDTGYSTHFSAASAGWPRCLYRWVTPVRSTITTADRLRTAGIDPNAIREVIITHFHADHIGGVKDFPHARFHYCAEALTELEGLSPFNQTRHAFLPGLLPADFAARSSAIPLARFSRDAGLGFSTFDVFGDGAVRFVYLPGHAPGQVGVFLPRSAETSLLYAADAFWHFRQVDETLEPAPPARLVIHDNAAYRQTIAQLRVLGKRPDITLLACHCPRTQREVD